MYNIEYSTVVYSTVVYSTVVYSRVRCRCFKTGCRVCSTRGVACVIFRKIIAQKGKTALMLCYSIYIYIYIYTSQLLYLVVC